MEIIKQGIHPSTWRKKIICPRCEAHLEISWKDIFVTIKRRETLFSTKFDRKYHVTCLECEHTINLMSREIPDIIKDEIHSNMSTMELFLKIIIS